MNWDLNSPTSPAKKETLQLENFEPDEQSVLTILAANNNQLMIDELSWRSGVPVSKLAAVLLGLEFKGVVATLPGKMYKLVGF